MVWSLIEKTVLGDEDLPPAWRDRAKGWRSHAEDAKAFLRATVEGPLDEPICFVHVPKCAGITADSAIRRKYRSLWEYEGKGMRSLQPGAADEVGEMYGISNWHVRESVLAYHLAQIGRAHV